MTVQRTSRPEPSGAAWRKSSYSNQEGGNCVEVAQPTPGLVAVRDSKDPQGPVLTFPSESWSTFIADLTENH
jgi:hypothetical protein